MSLTLNLLTFSKRENSTKVPSSAQISAGRELSVLLKDATSVYNPTFILRTSDPHLFNYAYCPAFGKYYFIRDWVSDHDLWNCICEEDVLASFRGVILGSTQYVLRSSAEWDNTIPDTSYPTKVSFQAYDTVMSAQEQPFASNDIPGMGNTAALCYVVATIGGDQESDQYTPPFSGVNYYLMNPAKFREFMDYVSEDLSDYLNVTEIGQNLLRALYDPFQYIVSVRLYPFNIISSGEGVTWQPVSFGYWKKAGLGHKLPTSISERYFYVGLQQHPQAAARGVKMNLSPWTERVLHIEPFGDIQIDSLFTADKARLYCRIQTDLITGDSLLEIKAIPDYGQDPVPSWDSIPGQGVIASAHSKVGVDIPIHAMRTDYIGIGQALLGSASTGLSMVTPSPVGLASGVLNTASSIGDAVKAAVPSLSKSGTAGSYLAKFNKGRLTSKFTLCVDEDIQNYGRPLCKRRVLSSLIATSGTNTGYCLCSNADIDMAGTAQEKNSIYDHLNNGVFLE